MRLLLKENVVGRYDSPRFKDFTKESMDPDLGPRYRDTIIGIVYNKSMIKPEETPKSIEDLLKPQFRGKLVMPDPTQHTTTTEWVASIPKLMGKEKGEKFIRDLAAAKPLLVESLLPAAERLSTGESAIAITYVKFAYLFGLKGAPLDYMRTDKMLGEGSYIMLVAKPAHPSAGKAFIDFFLDDENFGPERRICHAEGSSSSYPGCREDKIHRNDASRSERLRGKKERIPENLFAVVDLEHFNNVHRSRFRCSLDRSP